MKNNSIDSYPSLLIENKFNIAVLKGLFVSICTSTSIVLFSILFPNNAAIAILAVVIIPFIILFIFTKNIVDSLTIVWINEIFFGVSGTWIKIGPLPGRGILLILVLIIYILLNGIQVNLLRKIRKRSFFIIFYGLIFPAFLFAYSVIIRENRILMALIDVMRFSAILMYFPIRDLIRRNFDLFLGWIIGASNILAILIIALAIAPHNIRILLSTLWIKESIFYTYYDIDRAAYTIIILCFIGFFFGMMYVIDYNQSFLKKILGFILSAIPASLFVITFMRGPILSIASVFVIIISLFSLRKVYRLYLVHIIIINTFFVIAGYYLTVNYIPMSHEKWAIAGQDFSQMVNPLRIEQTDKMLKAWVDEPFFGKGIGSPVPNYSRTNEKEGLTFEVQYPMILYRVGLVGFIITMFPFVFFIYRAIYVIIVYYWIFKTNLGKLFMANAFAIIALLIASWSNPYLSSVMTFLFVVLFIALDDRIRIYCSPKDRVVVVH